MCLVTEQKKYCSTPVSVHTVPCINTQQFKSLTIIGQVPESIIYYAWYKATSLGPIGPVNWGNVI